MMRFLGVLLLLISTLNLNAQKKHTLSGYIKNPDGEVLIGATVYVPDIGAGTATNVYGFYSLTLPEGTYQVKYTYLGHDESVKTVELKQESSVNTVLSPSTQELEEVTITARRKDENIKTTQMSAVKLQTKQIKKIPTLMGEADIIKAIQLLPGVQTAGEGFSGFNVRGGSADQNLILLDEATVYNASHLMGFFSVFNNDAINDLQLYKGDIPAAYGGRLSSLLDIRMKEGNQHKFKARGGIGTISSRLTLEGPITEKSSFMLSGRRSYADLFLPLASDPDVQKNTLYFYDLNGKANFRINENNRLYLSAYTGRDVFDYDGVFGFNWGNYTTTLRWNHLFSKKLFSNFSAIYSNYDYELGETSSATGFLWTSNLKDAKLKADFSYYPNPKHTIKFGISGAWHHFSPGYARGQGDSTIFNSLKVPESNALEYALYISNKHKINEKLTINYGLRATMFQNMGKTTLYNFNDQYQTVDSTVYDKGDIFNTYMGLEPRISLRYQLNNKSSVKASYSRTKQYVHLASNSTAGSPLDVWVPSTPNIKPQLADQWAVGYFRNFFDNELEASIELYYKKMENQIDFKDHAEILLNPQLEGEFRFGKAKSAGLELLVRKQVGKLTGWVSYTYSKTERNIEEINDGNWYPASYDRPHNVSVVGSYDFNERWNVSANWTYYTGSAVTFPVGRFSYGNTVAPIYSTRNDFRLPDYHRMDLAVTYKTKKREGRRFHGEWNLSIYNVYNRKNAWLINFEPEEDNPDELYAEKVYLFPIIPSISYNFYF
jgi:outer membrane cobalamin receptor